MITPVMDTYSHKANVTVASFLWEVSLLNRPKIVVVKMRGKDIKEVTRCVPKIIK